MDSTPYLKRLHTVLFPEPVGPMTLELVFSRIITLSTMRHEHDNDVVLRQVLDFHLLEFTGGRHGGGKGRAVQSRWV